MKRLFLLLLLLILLSDSFAQSREKGLYRTEITTHEGTKAVGILFSLGDSTIQLIPLSEVRRGVVNANPLTSTHAVKDIYMLRIRKKGAPGKGALLGGGAGLLLGALIGNITYSPCEPSGSQGSWFGCIEIIDQTESMVIGGVLGAAAGAGIGTLAGASNRRILLYGDVETYRQQKSKLEQFVLSSR